MPPAAPAKPISHPRTYDWTPSAPWACPNCGAVVVTKDAAPRCSDCGFRESTY